MPQPIARLSRCSPSLAIARLANVTPIHNSPYRRERPPAVARLEFAVALELVVAANAPPEVEYGIVLSAHNEATALRSTLRPLLQLTAGVWALVVVLDDTSDDSAAVVGAKLASHAARPPAERVPTRRLASAQVLRVAAPGLYEVAALNLGMRLLSPRGFYVMLQADMLLGEVGWNHWLSLVPRQHADVFVVSGRCAHDYPLTHGGQSPMAGQCSRRFFERLANASAVRREGAHVRDSANIGPYLVRADAMRALGFFDEQRYHLGSGFEHDLC
eukprot:1521161-Prymnesium_polylepis.1